MKIILDFNEIFVELQYEINVLVIAYNLKAKGNTQSTSIDQRCYKNRNRKQHYYVSS